MFKATGKAVLWSYVIHHRPVPGFTPPYAIAVVQLAEGPKMMTNIVDCDFKDVKIGMKVKLKFINTEDGPPMPFFAPVPPETSLAGLAITLQQKAVPVSVRVVEC